MELSSQIPVDDKIFVIFDDHVQENTEMGIMNPNYQDDIALQMSPSESSTVALEDLVAIKNCQLKNSTCLRPVLLMDKTKNESKKESKEEPSEDSLEDRNQDKDPWAVAIPGMEDGPKFRDIPLNEKLSVIMKTILRWFILLSFLYLFVCSLDILSLGFSLLGGKAIGAVVANNDLLTNPLCGLMIGLLVTVLVQSSSTTTSVVVAMVSAQVVSVGHAIPIIMGTNIGTAVTNTLVSFGQVRDQEVFRRAFAGAAVHDIFNCLTVAVLLPIEMATGYLEVMTDAAITAFQISETNQSIEFLKVITTPFTDLIVQVHTLNVEDVDLILGPNTSQQSILRKCVDISTNSCTYRHIFAHTTLSDVQVGLIILTISLFGVSCSLLVTVKLLNSFLKGSITRLLKRFVNEDFPGYLAFLTGYLAILIGAICTFLVQSSSIFTSLLTPLVGIDVVSIDRMYPLTLGSNIGTTITGIISALASNGGELSETLHIALCHFFFNVTGIVIWYPIPFLRKVPITLAKLLGNKMSKHRWFAVLYVAVMFLILPGAVFGLSVAGDPYLMGFGIPILTLMAFVILISILQTKAPHILPAKLRTWECLPLWMHSLKPFEEKLVCFNKDEKHPDDEGNHSA